MMLYVNTVVLYVNMLLFVRMMFYVSTRWRRGKVRMMVSGGWQCDGGSVLLSSVAVPACEAVESQPRED